MTKKSVTFRFSEHTLGLLGSVSEAEGRTRTQVLEGLIQEAEARLGQETAQLDRLRAQGRSIRKPSSGPDRDKLAAFAQQNMGRGKRS